MCPDVGVNNTVIENILSLRDLKIGFHKGGDRPGFEYGPVKLDIRPGDLVALIGRNGIGKSSLLRTMTGLQKPLGGSVIFRDQELKHYSRQELSRLISFVSTERVVVQNLSIYDMVALGRSPYTNWLGKLTGEDRQMIDFSLQQANINHLSNKHVHQLSDGERQKVMIARALAQNTPVIFLDEPTAFLDLPSRHDISRLMYNLTLRHGKTVVFSTHDLDIAIHEADVLWLMNDDAIIEGAPEDLLFNQGFHKLFLNSSFHYDQQSDRFKLTKELSGKIALKGKEEYVFYTAKALERIGLAWCTGESSQASIEVLGISGQPVWNIKRAGREMQFKSIYEMASYLKRQFK